MNTPISWIKAYVPDLDVTAQEFVDAMTLSGSHVEGYEQKDKNLDKIVVGKILTMEKHPDADLHVTFAVLDPVIEKKGKECLNSLAGSHAER